MTVSLTIANSLGGNEMSAVESLGSVSGATGGQTDHIDYFVSHDGESSITDVAVYIMRFVESGYPGTDPDADLATLLGWGDTGDGGVKLSMAPPNPWTEGTRFSSGWQTIKNGYGDVNNQIILDEDSLVVGTPAGDGIIPSDAVSHIQFEVEIPSGASVADMGFETVISYSATS